MIEQLNPQIYRKEEKERNLSKLWLQHVVLLLLLLL